MSDTNIYFDSCRHVYMKTLMHYYYYIIFVYIFFIGSFAVVEMNVMSVLTAAEDAGLTEMAAGIQRQYETVGQSSPTLMYVDWDCCSSTGDSAVARMFCMWPDLAVWLDVRHFIRRFRSACTNDTHPCTPSSFRSCPPASSSGMRVSWPC